MKVDNLMSEKIPSEQEREERLKKSLPYLDNADIPVFPKVQIKEQHTLLYLIIVAVIIFIMIAFNLLFAIARVDGQSMNTTLHNGEIVLLSRHEKIRRFDIVVLRERTTNNGSDKKIIKRVIGFPGDVITVINGKLYINNERYKENYLNPKNIVNFKTVNWTIKVPKGRIFVLGDNRDISKDSRIVGSFNTSAVVGVKILGGKD